MATAVTTVPAAPSRAWASGADPTVSGTSRATDRNPVINRPHKVGLHLPGQTSERPKTRKQRVGGLLKTVGRFISAPFKFVHQLFGSGTLKSRRSKFTKVQGAGANKSAGESKRTATTTDHRATVQKYADAAGKTLAEVNEEGKPVNSRGSNSNSPRHHIVPVSENKRISENQPRPLSGIAPVGKATKLSGESLDRHQRSVTGAKERHLAYVDSYFNRANLHRRLEEKGLRDKGLGLARTMRVNAGERAMKEQRQNKARNNDSSRQPAQKATSKPVTNTAV